MGRYRNKIEELSVYFSEFALIKYRVYVEVEYFIALCNIPLEQLKEIDSAKYSEIRQIYLDFTLEDANRIKTIENTTNHDVKAVEYFLKEKFDLLNLSGYKEFIHFGLTSQDINNTAFPLMMRDSIVEVYNPAIAQVINRLKAKSDEWLNIPMLARTHGQPASPTSLGKEIRVFVERLEEQFCQLNSIPNSAKLS